MSYAFFALAGYLFRRYISSFGVFGKILCSSCLLVFTIYVMSDKSIYLFIFSIIIVLILLIEAGIRELKKRQRNSISG